MACLENYIKISLQVTWPYVETVRGSPSLHFEFRTSSGWKKWWNEGEGSFQKEPIRFHSLWHVWICTYSNGWVGVMPRYLSAPHALSSCQLPKCPWFQEFLKHFSSIFIVSRVLVGAGTVTIWHTYHIRQWSRTEAKSPLGASEWLNVQGDAKTWKSMIEATNFSTLHPSQDCQSDVNHDTFAKALFWCTSTGHFEWPKIVKHAVPQSRVTLKFLRTTKLNRWWFPHRRRSFWLGSLWDVGRNACSETGTTTLIFPSLIQSTE